jgi:hypothetical protein
MTMRARRPPTLRFKRMNEIPTPARPKPDWLLLTKDEMERIAREAQR